VRSVEVRVFYNIYNQQFGESAVANKDTQSNTALNGLTSDPAPNFCVMDDVGDHVMPEHSVL